MPQKAASSLLFITRFPHYYYRYIIRTWNKIKNLMRVILWSFFWIQPGKSSWKKRGGGGNYVEFPKTLSYAVICVIIRRNWNSLKRNVTTVHIPRTWMEIVLTLPRKWSCKFFKVSLYCSWFRDSRGVHLPKSRARRLRNNMSIPSTAFYDEGNHIRLGNFLTRKLVNS